MRPTIHHTLLCALLPTMALSQSSVGEQAYAVAGERSPAKQASIRTIVLDAPPPANDALNGADARKGGFTYGVPRPLALDFMAEATWSTGPTGEGVIGQLAVQSPGAQTMSLLFSSVELVGNAQLIVRDNAGTHVLAPYTAETKLGKGGDLHTAVVPGDQVVIEFHGTYAERNISVVRLKRLIHGHLDLFDGVGAKRSGLFDCLVDVACPLGDDWVDQRRATVMFLREDGNGCTGVLLNNTANDQTPYVQIANHCFPASYTNPGLPPSPDPNNWVFYFNYEKSSCDVGSGSLSQSITGAQKISRNSDGDFALLELNEQPPSSYNVYYSGWDITGNTPDHGAYIGHPVTDESPRTAEKKIATYTTIVSGSHPNLANPTWNVDVDQGSVYGGSSGSPLFNEDKRFVGHIIDADGDCDNGIVVWAPKITGNWNGSEDTTRLKDWLDPGSTNATTLDGFYPTINLRVKMFLQGAYNPGNGIMRADLTVPTTEPYTGLSYTHVNGGGGETTTSGVLLASGNAKIVDWVVIELRATTSPHGVLATRSALLRRDGHVVEVDGSDLGVRFPGVSGTNFRVAVRHRNHLGVMTGADLDLRSSMRFIDFSDTTITLLYGTQPAHVSGSTSCLWMGDVIPDGVVKYLGTNNDRDPILTAVGGGTPTAVVYGYLPEDVNMDGMVKYLGTDNDRDPILSVVGGATPTATRSAQLP